MVPLLQDELCLIVYRVVVVLILNLCSGVVEIVFCVGNGPVGGVEGCDVGWLGIWVKSL